MDTAEDVVGRRRKVRSIISQAGDSPFYLTVFSPLKGYSGVVKVRRVPAPDPSVLGTVGAQKALAEQSAKEKDRLEANAVIEPLLDMSIGSVRSFDLDLVERVTVGHKTHTFKEFA